MVTHCWTYDFLDAFESSKWFSTLNLASWAGWWKQMYKTTALEMVLYNSCIMPFGICYAFCFWETNWVYSEKAAMGKMSNNLYQWCLYGNTFKFDAVKVGTDFSVDDRLEIYMRYVCIYICEGGIYYIFGRDRVSTNPKNIAVVQHCPQLTNQMWSLQFPWFWSWMIQVLLITFMLKH